MMNSLAGFPVAMVSLALAVSGRRWRTRYERGVVKYVGSKSVVEVI